MDDSNQEAIVKVLEDESAGKGIVRFISTHPDDDHIRGLTYLDEQMHLVNFYCVENKATKEDPTDDFEQYCSLRDDPKKAFFLYRGCKRKWLNEKSEERGGAGIHVLWPDTSHKDYQEALKTAAQGGTANNISAIFQYRLEGGASVVWMGDLETGFMEQLETIPVEQAHVLFAPHHGRDTGRVPAEWLGKMKPKLIIIGEAPSEHLNYYAGYNTVTQNSAGDITLNCEGDKVHIYVSDPVYEADFLANEDLSHTHGFYIGTLQL
jgi:beta-lactamase superfamily II metal-dependent hydrolase